MRASPGLRRDVDVERVWRCMTARRRISPQRRLIVFPTSAAAEFKRSVPRASVTHPSRDQVRGRLFGLGPPSPALRERVPSGARRVREGRHQVSGRRQFIGRRQACGWRVRCSRQSEANSRLNGTNTRLPAPLCCVKALIELGELAVVREKFAVVSGFYRKSAGRVGIVNATRFCMARTSASDSHGL